MDERVEKFLKNNESSSEKDEMLIEAGLYDKVTMPEADAVNPHGNKRVEEFLANNESTSERDEILIEAGLYDKIYMPETDAVNPYKNESLKYDYPESEYDEKKGRTVYYRKQAIKVTDEEYEAILRCISGDKNLLADIITWGAYIVFAIGFIVGIPIGTSSGFATTLMVWLIAGISGISLLWFAEVLKLLQDIKNRLNRK